MDASDARQQDTSRRPIPRSWLAAGAIALLVLALLGYALAGRPTQPPQRGSPVPPFQLTAFDGSAIDLGASQGKVVVLNFFASWCEPCRQEAADLQRVWEEYREKGVQFYGIGYKDAASKAQAFLAEYGVTYPAAVETRNRTARSYGVTGVPETFIIDRAGRLVRHIIGPITRGELSQVLDSLLEP